MARYHLHLHDRTGFVEDPEGLELADVNQARVQALKAARSIIKQDVDDGWVDLTGRIEVADGDGAVLLTLSFKEAVRLKA